jgi:hypothetical protein
VNETNEKLFPVVQTNKVAPEDITLMNPKELAEEVKE